MKVKEAGRRVAVQSVGEVRVRIVLQHAWRHRVRQIRPGQPGIGGGIHSCRLPMLSILLVQTCGSLLRTHRAQLREHVDAFEQPKGVRCGRLSLLARGGLAHEGHRTGRSAEPLRRARVAIERSVRVASQSL